MADQSGRATERGDGVAEVRHEAFRADRERVVDLAAAVPGCVVGVDGA